MLQGACFVRCSIGVLSSRQLHARSYARHPGSGITVQYSTAFRESEAAADAGVVRKHQVSTDMIMGKKQRKHSGSVGFVGSVDEESVVDETPTTWVGPML